VVGFSLSHLSYGYDPRSPCDWFADRRTPEKLLDRLAHDLGVTGDRLLSGDTAPPTCTERAQVQE
jgi:hypothetical protein